MAFRIAHFFISILQRTCEKNFMAYVRLKMNLSPSLIRASTLLAGPPLPLSRARTLWITLREYVFIYQNKT